MESELLKYISKIQDYKHITATNIKSISKLCYIGKAAVQTRDT